MIRQARRAIFHFDEVQAVVPRNKGLPTCTLVAPIDQARTRHLLSWVLQVASTRDKSALEGCDADMRRRPLNEPSRSQLSACWRFGAAACPCLLGARQAGVVRLGSWRTRRPEELGARRARTGW